MFKKLNTFDKIGFIFLFMCLIGFAIFVYYLVFYQVKISPFDNVLIGKCIDCENLIIKKNSECKIYTCKWSAPCETFKYYKYLAKVITPQNKEYEMFKLKYDFYNVCNGNFNEFYQWYQLNKDKKFYKYIRLYKVKKYTSPFKTEYESETRMVGRTLVTKSVPYIKFVESKVYDSLEYDTQYNDPNDPDYEKIECNIFEYYSHAIVKSYILR